MSRPKDPLRYPEPLYRMIDELDKKPNSPWFFQFESRAEVTNFRLTFNSFKKAALDHGWGKSRCPSLASMVCRVDYEKHTATILRIETDPLWARIGKVVGVEPPEDRKEPERDAYAARSACEHDWLISDNPEIARCSKCGKTKPAMFLR